MMAGAVEVLFRQGHSRLLMLLCLLVKIVAAETVSETDDADKYIFVHFERKEIRYLLYAAICAIVVVIGIGIAFLTSDSLKTKIKDSGHAVGVVGAIFVGIAIFCMYRLGYFNIL
uniref:Uncharacterized protein n=1 Tax=Babesia bovis TaxID=5865 RepID=S6BNT8_BABBO|nr:hypothetical protein [Babesia bovis]